MLPWFVATHVIADSVTKELTFIGGMSYFSHYIGHIICDLGFSSILLLIAFISRFCVTIHEWDDVAVSFDQIICLYVIATAGWIRFVGNFTHNRTILQWGPLLIAMCAYIAIIVLALIKSLDIDTLKIVLKIIQSICPLIALVTAFIRTLIQGKVSFLEGSHTILIIQAIVFPALAMLVDYFRNGLFLQADTKEFDETQDQSPDVSNERKNVYGDFANQAGTYEHHFLGLTKIFGSGRGPNNIAFGIKKNEIFGFLGTNGAGKTTTLKMISGQLKPTIGKGYIKGVSIDEQVTIRQMIGYCMQDNDVLYENLTVLDHLNFYSMVKGLFDKQKEDQINLIITELSLESFINVRSSHLSGGNKRKLCVGIALLGNPILLILDEPTSGIDPIARRNLWNFIKLISKSKSVLLTSHTMEEVEALTSRLTIMVDGKLKCIGSKQYLKNKYSKGYTIGLEYLMENKSNGATANANQLLEEFKNYQTTLIESSSSNLKFQINIGLEQLADIYKNLQRLKNQRLVKHYSVNQTNIEEIFISMTNRSNRTQFTEIMQGGANQSYY